MERLHNGSSEKGWPKEDSKKKDRKEGRPQEGDEKESDQEAPLALWSGNKKAGILPAFLFLRLPRDTQRE
jgi:hypothetical protein